jgi:hypothetical protein
MSGHDLTPDYDEPVSHADLAAVVTEPERLLADLALSRNLYDELFTQTEQLRVEIQRLRDALDRGRRFRTVLPRIARPSLDADDARTARFAPRRVHYRLYGGFGRNAERGCGWGHMNGVYRWEDLMDALAPRAKLKCWVETRHSTLCALHISGHRGPCTCEPKLIPHFPRIDRLIRGDT